MSQYNKLTPAEAERLFILSEECGEVVQAIGKVLRHGWDEKYANGRTNRDQLEVEIADVLVLVAALMQYKDINVDKVADYGDKKLDRINTYMHHNVFKAEDYE